MKASVLESSNGRSVILAEDGLFYSTIGDYRVGETIEYDAEAEKKRYASKKAKSSIVKIAVSAVACLMLIVSGASYSYQNLMVYADVTFESNMPILCRLNRKCEIVKIEPADKSGITLAANMNREGLKGKKIEGALKYAQKYVKKYTKAGENSTLSVKVDCKDEAEKEKLTLKLNEELTDEDENTEADTGDIDTIHCSGVEEEGAEDSGIPSEGDGSYENTGVTPSEQPAVAPEETPTDEQPVIETPAEEKPQTEEEQPAKEDVITTDEAEDDTLTIQESGTEDFLTEDIVIDDPVIKDTAATEFTDQITIDIPEGIVFEEITE